MRSIARWISIAIVISAGLITNAIHETRPPAKTIYVKGYAEKKIKSDSAAITCYYSAQAEKLPDAYTLLERNTTEVIAFLKGKGCNENEITKTTVSIQKKYKKDEKGNDTPEIQQYVLSSGFTVNSSDVNKISTIASSISSLIAKNIDISVVNLKYMVSNLDELKKQMLGEAIRNATERASIITKKSNSNLGQICSASQGIFQITAPDSTDVSDYGEYDTSTIEKTIKAVVSVTFAIK